MSHLDTLRAICLAANDIRPMAPIDGDLSAEAGMDGNYARLLQAARMLDEHAEDTATRASEEAVEADAAWIAFIGSCND